MMDQEEIQKATARVMALRPESKKLRKAEPRSTCQLKRMNRLQLQQEIDAIMQDEIPNASAFFFRNNDASKGGRKNIKFNPYVSKSKS